MPIEGERSSLQHQTELCLQYLFFKVLASTVSPFQSEIGQTTILGQRKPSQSATIARANLILSASLVVLYFS